MSRIPVMHHDKMILQVVPNTASTMSKM